jgi:hypothetical protein
VSAVIVAFTALTVLLFLSSSVQATSPPPTFVLETRSVTFINDGASISPMNVTWRVSPEDPDQINGSFTYSLYARCPTVAAGYVRFNLTDVPLPGRTGWLERSTNLNLGPPFCGLGTLDFNMTAWNGTDQSSPSCPLNVTIDRMESTSIFFANKTIVNQGQCGDRITIAPGGIAAQVKQTVNFTRDENSVAFVPTLVDVKWPISVNDTNQTVGDFNYAMQTSVIGNDGSISLSGIELDPRQTGTNGDGGGYRIRHIVYPDGLSNKLNYRVSAWDPVTRMRSNFTCAASIDTAINGSSSQCGDVDAFAALNGLMSGTTVLFPFVPAASIATDFGLPQALAPWFLGIVWIGFLAGLGLWIAQAPGVMVGGIIGLGSAGMMGLIPLWLIILVFAALAAFALIYYKSGGESA